MVSYVHHSFQLLICSGHMDKQVLTSVKASESVGRYVAGVFRNGKFISSLSVCQFILFVSGLGLLLKLLKNSLNLIYIFRDT